MNDVAFFSKIQMQTLSAFLEENKQIDLLTLDLSTVDSLANFEGLGDHERKEEMLKLLLPCQRLKKIMPDLPINTLFSLLNAGYHSAIQIAAVPRAKFVHDFAALFGDETALVERFYGQALAIRAQVLLTYIKTKQSSEPHIRAARIQG